jgi:hypothetical protein
MNRFRKVEWDLERLKRNPYLNPQGTPHSTGNIDDILAHLDIEPEKENKLMTYKNSLKRLSDKGYERHLYPNEAFAVIYKGLEEPEGPYGKIAQDMLEGWGEWTNIAMKRKGNTLSIATDPENILWTSVGYRIKDNQEIQCKNRETYTINGNERYTIITTLEETDHTLVRKLWGTDAKTIIEHATKFGNSPDSIGLWVFDDNIWRPVVRGGSGLAFDSVNARGTSRGVRVKQ